MAWYGIGFTDAVKRALQKYATFTGRASRGEFWWFYLAWIIAAFIPFVNMVCVLVGFIPLLALIWRRLHDVGKSGWTYGIILIINIAVGLICAGIIIDLLSQGSSYSYTEDYNYEETINNIFAAQLFYLITCSITGIYLLIQLAQRPQPTANEYGPGPQAHLQEIATLNNLNRLISAEEKVVNELDEEINAKMQELGDINITDNMDTRYMEHLHNKQTKLTVEIEELQNEKELRQENLEEIKEKRAYTSSATPPRNTTQAPPIPPPPPSIPQPPPPPPDPVLAELADPTTSATRLHEIAALATEHPEYRAPLLEHPNIYPALKQWINQLG